VNVLALPIPLGNITGMGSNGLFIFDYAFGKAALPNTYFDY